jgi:hypothetical protein
MVEVMKRQSSARRTKKTVTVRAKRIKDLDAKKKVAGGKYSFKSGGHEGPGS